LNYKVSENKLYSKQAGNIFGLTLYISKHKQHQIHKEKRHVTKVFATAGLDEDQSAANLYSASVRAGR
jgi:hypothetical protein